MEKMIKLVSVCAIAGIIPVLLYPHIYSFFSDHMQPYGDLASYTYESVPVRELLPKHRESKLLFVGDIMLDRSIRKDGERLGYDTLFSCLVPLFKEYDEVIGNLEGTVTNFSSVSRDAGYLTPESFRFTFDPVAVQDLVNAGLSIVSLANNHIRDFGEEGVKQTVQNTQDMGLVTFGDPRNGSTRYVIHEIDGARIAFIPYNEFFGTKEQVFEDIEQVTPLSDLQIVYAHWGDEYVPPRADVRQLAHDMVDKGVDLVIGSHPHVIQEIENYKGVPIYYSLGNFIFDQYWEEAVRKGMIVDVRIKNKIIVDTEPMYVESTRNAGTCPIKDSPATNTESIPA